VPKRATRKEVEALFHDAGLQITRSQFRIDRFTFHNDSYYHAELASPEQAEAAISQLHLSTALSERDKQHPIIVKLMDPEKFRWKGITSLSNRFFYDEGDNAAKALLPVKEGRRVQVRVQTPFWKPTWPEKPAKISASRKGYGAKLMRDAFERFGIEAMSDVAFNDSRVTEEPKHYCHIDFKTKEGAEEAIRELDETELEERKIEVRKNEVNGWRAQQFGRVDMDLLEELQQLGLAPRFHFSEPES